MSGGERLDARQCALISQAIEATQSGVFIVDETHAAPVVRYSNEAAAQLLTGATALTAGIELDTLLAPLDARLAGRIRAALDRGEATHMVVQRQDAGHGWLDIRFTTIADVRGIARAWVGVVHDVTPQKELEDRLVYCADHDALTGLPNRQCLQAHLAAVLSEAEWARERVGILFLDLDGFKQVNDSCGHFTGDIVLQHVAERLQGRMRAGDMLARLGGDEFVLLVRGRALHHELPIQAARMLGVFDAPVQADDACLDVSCSIGAAVFPDDSHCPATLLRCADQAMYRAKKAGGRTMRWFNPPRVT